MDCFFLGGRLVVDLLNTVIVQDGQVRDLLGTRGGGTAAAWARAAGVTRGHLDGAHEPAGLQAFREELRRGLVAWAATGKPSPRLVALVNRYLARDPEVTELRLERGTAVSRRRAAGEALARVYGAVARSAAELVTTGDPRRLRKCANPPCRLMFYDVSKAGRRRWCSMRTCGARAKARAFRARRAPPPRAATR